MTVYLIGGSTFTDEQQQAHSHFTQIHSLSQWNDISKREDAILILKNLLVIFIKNCIHLSFLCDTMAVC